MGSQRHGAVLRVNAIPMWSEAVRRLEVPLEDEGHPSRLAWAFRDDLWPIAGNRLAVCWPLVKSNMHLAESVFARGRAKGLVEVVALASDADYTIATAWFPKTSAEEVQGWDRGLKVSLRVPVRRTVLVPRALWPLVRLVPAFRRYQRRDSFVGTRLWASQ